MMNAKCIIEISKIKKLTYRVIIFFTVLLVSCINKPIPADISKITNQYAENKDEIEKLINYYNVNESDSLKLKAAYFLIRNMHGLYSLDSTSVAQNSVYFDAIEHETNKKGSKLSNDSIYYIIDSINSKLNIKPHYNSPKYRPDLKILSSSFLIENIELAFHAWEKFPWSQNTSFEDFCEYILPYRCSDSYSLNARKFFLTKYNWIADSLKECSNPFEIARVIIDDINSWYIEDPTLLATFPYLNNSTFSDFLKGKVGSCKHTTEIIITALRAMGIPTAYDCLLNWANSNSSHFWYKIVDDKNDTINYKLTNLHKPIDTQNIITGSSYAIYPRLNGVPDNVNLYFNRTVSKVYRKSFKKNKLDFGRKEIENIPPVLRDNRITDVTSRYVECVDLNYKLHEKHASRIIALLCFDNTKWTVQCIGEICQKNNNVVFKNIGKNIVYMPAIYENGEYYFIDKPFLLKDDGNIHSLDNNGNTRSITLYSKYPFRSEIELWFAFMIGGKFKVANKKDLSDSKVIHVIDTVPFYEQTKKINIEGKYKYFIYDYSNVNNFRYDVGDIYVGNHEINGFIGNQGVYGHTVKEAFDGDKLSFFSHDETSSMKHIGIELKEPSEIEWIRFAPRNDDNAINRDESYELFYWNDGWVSLGVKTSRSNSVTFENVPGNALFLLKNTKGGTENRIFTYLDNKQHFW